jgi:transcriptional regulator GlxA family with amidase domain
MRGVFVLAAAAVAAHDRRMQTAFVLYDRFTALDIIGPFQTLADVPGVDAFFVAERVGPVRDHTGRLSLVATKSFQDVTAPDVVVVPGGMADREATVDHPVVRWLRRVHPTTTWTTSVCTGSIFLGLAGIVAGLEATCHWASMDRLAALGATPTGRRVVRQGKVITAAGVSSGIDMGLTLVAEMFGADTARAIQLAIEYDPQPPFDAGSPAKAGPEVVAIVAGLFGRDAEAP